MTNVLIIGGAGAIGRRALAAALACSAVDDVVLADLDGETAAREAAKYPGRVSAMALDVFDEPALRAAMRGKDAALNCAGPFHRTSLPCLKAAIAERCAYLDVCDGWETTRAMLDLDAEARAVGVAAIVGIGAAPGVVNLLARVAASELDRCDEIVTGANMDAEASPEGSPGRTVHWARQLGGPVEVWRDGAVARIAPLQPLRVDLPGVGARELYIIGHPEPLTLSRSVAGLRAASHVLALDAKEKALALSLRQRVASGALDAEKAARMARDPAARPWDMRLRLAVAGLGRGGEKAFPPLFACATGVVNERPRRVGVWLSRLPVGGAAAASGAAIAVALELALTRRLDRVGVSAPEDILDAHIFFEEYAPHATPRGVAPGPLLRIETADG